LENEAMNSWLASLTALFLWWFSTGAILLVIRRADRRGRGAHGMAVLAGVPVLVLGMATVGWSLDQVSVKGAYAGFLGALMIWGWIELAFLGGVITGPMRAACPPGLAGRARFQRAWGTVAHHELLLTAALLGLVMASNGAANQVAVQAYLILYFARISAKLNLFFGVPRINVEFVPARLAYLASYFRRGPATLMLPLAITGLTAALAVCIERLLSAADPGAITGYALLTALTALALLEHWLMVVPLPDARLWRWMLPAASPLPKPMTPEER
jgi:putative photosynthetic complex assembly protein 2